MRGWGSLLGMGACRFQVERLLEGVDSCVYLLDYTKLKTQEEANLLKRLSAINPQLFSRLSQRLFFVINKADVVRACVHLHAWQGPHDAEVYIPSASGLPPAKPSQALKCAAPAALQIETSEGMDAASTKEYVANLITHQMQQESFQLQPEQVRAVAPSALQLAPLPEAQWQASPRIRCLSACRYESQSLGASCLHRTKHVCMGGPACR